MTSSYERGPTGSPLLHETIGDRLREVSERHGDREALVVRHQGYRATYHELSAQVDAAARALLARGVATGDRVGIWAPNRYEWVVVQYAAARVGAILVTIDPAYLLGNLAAMTRGACIVVPGESFAAADVLRAVEAERCTSLYGVPTMFIDALAHTDLFDLSSLRKFVDAFPTTVTGKPQKYRMREIAVRELGLAS